jgi:hypothetical protein
MSDILKRYETSDSPRVKEARAIPGNEVNFFDRENKIQKEFDNFAVERDKTRTTTFTTDALNSFDKRVQNFTIPQSFTPVAPDVPLNRWTPNNKYYNPGSRK